MKRYFMVTVFVIFLDQLSKYWAMVTLTPFDPQFVLAFFNYTLAFNTGAAFSFLHNAGPWHQWFFAAMSICMSLLIVIWMFRIPKSERYSLLGLSLILGGALGNLIDRAHYGFVVDFIQLHYQNHYWPTFNIADSAICMGAFLLFWELF